MAAERLRAGLFLADLLALDFLAGLFLVTADFLAGAFFRAADRCGFLRIFFAAGFLTVLRVAGLAAFLAGFLRKFFLGAVLRTLFLAGALRTLFLAAALRTAGLAAAFFFAARLFAADFILLTAISILLSAMMQALGCNAYCGGSPRCRALCAVFHLRGATRSSG